LKQIRNLADDNLFGGLRVKGYSRFRGVVWLGGMADILGTLEHAERKAGQEVSSRQQPCHWPQLEPRLTWQGIKHDRDY